MRKPIYDWGEGLCSNCKHGWKRHITVEVQKKTLCEVLDCQCVWHKSKPYRRSDGTLVGERDGNDDAVTRASTP